jgi:hypothetical protein
VSFLVAAALGVGLLFVVPAVAHLLRRGRAKEVPFPPAALVPASRSTARQRRRLEDRLLLLIRVAAVLILSVLGATPLVQCSRISLSRKAGASVALALVIDDSLSMRARLGSGRTRYERSLEAAEQLLAGARSGDVVAIVLAGRPARLALATTTDLPAARRTLEQLRPSDRATDLAAAVTLARSAIADQPHADKRVVLFSDLAGEPLPEGKPEIWLPLPELAVGVHDCAVAGAERRGHSVNVSVACTTPEAASGRSLLAVPLSGSGVEPQSKSRELPAKPDTKKALGHAALLPRAGLQVVGLELEPNAEAALTLSGDDALPEDDVGALSQESGALSVAVNADPTHASAKTGGPTLLEQALGALDGEIGVHPLSVVPEDSAVLDPHALLLLDDPPGITPEARAVLVSWLERGGVAVAFIGRDAENLQLGTTLQPFVFGAIRWQSDELPKGLDPTSLGFLGAEARSLEDLRPHGRTRLDLGEIKDATVLGLWQDQKPWMVERRTGRGVVYSVSLPTSVEQSDLSLRPGFLALLEFWLEQASRRSGPRRSTAGAEWTLSGSNIGVSGPEGPLNLRELPSGEKLATPAVRGLYRVTYDKTVQTRVVAIEPGEVLLAPRAVPAQAVRAALASRARVDASSETAFLLVALLGLELLVRVIRSRSPRRAMTSPL